MNSLSDILKTHVPLKNYINPQLDHFSNSKKELLFLHKINDPFQKDQYVVYSKHKEDYKLGFNPKASSFLVFRVKSQVSNGLFKE